MKEVKIEFAKLETGYILCQDGKLLPYPGFVKAWTQTRLRLSREIQLGQLPAFSLIVRYEEVKK